MTSKTALELPREAWREYRPHRKIDTADEIWERAWSVTRQIARALKAQFGATRVVVFGSLTDKRSFTRWSDIDIAVWGIAPDQFYRAVAFATGFSPEFRVDLVDVEMCSPSLRARIEAEGIEL